MVNYDFRELPTWRQNSVVIFIIDHSKVTFVSVLCPHCEDPYQDDQQ